MEEAHKQVNEELRNLVQQKEKVKEEKKNCTMHLASSVLVWFDELVCWGRTG